MSRIDQVPSTNASPAPVLSISPAHRKSLEDPQPRKSEQLTECEESSRTDRRKSCDEINAIGTYLIVPPSLHSESGSTGAMRETSLGGDEEDEENSGDDNSNDHKNSSRLARYSNRPNILIVPSTVDITADWGCNVGTGAALKPSLRGADFHFLNNLLAASSISSQITQAGGTPNVTPERSAEQGDQAKCSRDLRTSPSHHLADTIPRSRNLSQETSSRDLNQQDSGGGYDSGKGSSEKFQDSPAAGLGPKEGRLFHQPQRRDYFTDGGVPKEEHRFQLKEECVAQTRHISVDREQCGHSERAEMSIVSDRSASKLHRAVTMSRSHTWSFTNRPGAAGWLSLKAGRRGVSRDEGDDIPHDIKGKKIIRKRASCIGLMTGTVTAAAAAAGKVRSRSHSTDRRSAAAVDSFGEEGEYDDDAEVDDDMSARAEPTVVQTYAFTDRDFAGNNRSYVSWVDDENVADSE